MKLLRLNTSILLRRIILSFGNSKLLLRTILELRIFDARYKTRIENNYASEDLRFYFKYFLSSITFFNDVLILEVILDVCFNVCQ